MSNAQHLGHMVEPGGGERLAHAGMEFVIRASAESTGGAFSIVEEIDAVDAPPHVHTNEDELFFVLEGDHVFTVGDEVFEVSPGGLVFGPRGVPHSQRHPDGGRTLTLLSPAGFEQFFRDIAAAQPGGGPDFEHLERIARTHGVRFVTDAGRAEGARAEFQGRCAFAMGLTGRDKAPVADSKHTLERNGKHYVFLNPIAKLLFQILPGSERRAWRAWNTDR